MSRIFFFIFLLCFIWLSLSAQNELHFSHLGTESGFTLDKANTIVQDKKGFIWVGTWNGLNRFDGYSCINFQPGFHDSTSISNREITELMIDSKGNLWIGTSSGLNFMNLETGELKRYEFQNRILSLFEDHEGNIWIGTWTGGLSKLNVQTQKISTFLDNEIINDILEDSHNNMWIATHNGLLRFFPETEKYTRYVPDGNKNSLSHATVLQLAESKDDYLWIGTWGGGLNRAQIEPGGTLSHFSVFLAEGKPNSISANVIYKLFYDQFDNLWIGTWNSGLNLLMPDQQKLTPGKTRFLVYKEARDNPGGLSGNGVSSLYVDKGGLLWVGAEKIDLASIVDKGLKRYILPKPENELSDNVHIRSFAAYKNQLWIGTDYNVLQYEKSGDIYILKEQYQQETYSYKNDNYTAYSVLDMFADSTGLWMGTEDAGLIHYSFTNDLKLDRKSRIFLNRETQPSIPGDKVTELCPSKSYPGVIWLGTMDNGFAKLQRTPDGKISVERIGIGNNPRALSSNNIRALYEDHNGKVWVGTQSGLNRFDPKTEACEKYYYSVSDKNSLNDNVVNAVFEDSENNLWIGTNSGLNKKIEIKDSEGNAKIKFAGYPSTDYLNNEFISSLMEDNSGHLWVRMYRGCIKFNIQKETTDEEYFSQDFKNLRLERNADLKLDDGSFILANQSGFITFYPDSVLTSLLPQKVELTDMLLYNTSISKLGENLKKYGINTTVPYIDRIKLSYKNKMVTFVFSAMDYKTPEKNTYYYQLEGFDDQWNVSEGRNSATYTNIPPGDYTFKVKAINLEGLGNTDFTSIGVFVSPPWWETIWAYIVYVLIIIGMLYFFRKYSIIKANEKHQLAFEKMKTEELHRLNEQKSLFFTDITHELRTPLTLILGPSKELLADRDLKPYAKKQAELIKNSAFKLLRLVNQLMEFRKIEKGVLDKLYIRRSNLGTLLTDVYTFFQPMAQSRKIDFVMEVGQEPVISFVDTEKMEKVIFNLISNAFKYTPDNGKIAVSVRNAVNNEGKQVSVIEVKDSGVGIATEYREKVFERFFQINQVRTQSTGGIGLFMAKALVEQHGGSIELDTEVEKGSCFRVLLPFNPELEKMAAADFVEQEIESLDYDIETNSTLPEEAGEIVSDHIMSVMVVEDDIDLNSFLVNGLKESFNVESAMNGREALEKLKFLSPDLILTDIMMPEMDGFEFCRTIRKNINLSHIPMVFLTAKTMKEDEMTGLKLGAVDYIYKPFNLDTLRLKIHNILIAQKRIQEQIRTEQILQPEHIELSSLDDKLLSDAVKAVNDNLDNPDYDVDAFSADLKLSSNQVYRKIKALTGQTAKEFIRNQRLKVAADLLAQQKRSISEVIYMVGFTSPSYFSRCFKDFYGCTPKDFIEKSAR